MNQEKPKDVVVLAGKSLGGSVQVPSSKSLGHRALLCAALSEEVSLIQNLQLSEDIEATLGAVRVLGASVSATTEGLRVKGQTLGHLPHPSQGSLLPHQSRLPHQPCLPHQPQLSQQASEPSAQTMTFECGESGSTLRFMIPIGLLRTGKKIFTGRGRLPERPLTEYLTNFQSLGINYSYEGRLPFATTDQLKSGRYVLSGGESSQYLSGLLMALPLLDGPSDIVIEGTLESKDYAALTLETMAAHGVGIEVLSESHLKIQGNQRYKGAVTSVEGDYSQAAFFIVAGLLGTEPVTCQGLSSNSQQADRRLIDIVTQMGGKLIQTADSLTALPSATRGTVIDASQCPDIIPVLAVLAACSEGETRVVNGQRLRIKESDRIKSTVSLLRGLGAMVTETEDGMVINGQQRLKGGRVDGFKDHRIVMAAAISAVRCQTPVVISGAVAVNKSYPAFFEDLEALGGQWHGDL